MKKSFHAWVNVYFYNPGVFERVLSMIFAPISLLYSCFIRLKKLFIKPVKFCVPVISVGNLILGGSGKTPLTKAIFELFSQKYRTFIILRGYKRKSKGLILVCEDGEILCDVNASGDEAMEYALFCPKANVIVSENRADGINEAIKRGGELVLLDDGFGKFDIEKFNILLYPSVEPKSDLTIPSGAYRYPKSYYALADFIPQKDDILSKIEILNESEKMLLIAGIANPGRLKFVFDKCVGREFFADHYDYKKAELEDLLKKHGASSILLTAKDFVKVRNFNLPLSLLVLKSTLSDNFKQKLENYITSFKDLR